MLKDLVRKVIGTKVVTTTTDPVLSTYPKEVLEIHHEFSTAADVLLASANKIIAETNVNKSKVDLMKSLGFSQAREVKESTDKIKSIELSEKQVQLVQKYKILYPSYKFITEEQIEFICHKYGLVFGDVADYRGFVPEKNLNEIEQFLKIHNKVLSKLGHTHLVDLYPYTYNRDDDDIEDIRLNVPMHIILKNDDEYAYCYIEGKYHNSLQQSKRKPGLISKGEYYGSCTLPSGEKFSGNIRVKPLGSVMKIAAPLKDMDMSGKTIENGYKVVKIKKDIPDPVVFHPVEGGYMISTMWADEQFDPHTEPMLRNDSFNN